MTDPVAAAEAEVAPTAAPVTTTTPVAAATGTAGPRAGVTAIVLAGGRAARFGGDKLTAELDGRPLLHRAIEAAAAVAAEIVVVAAPDREPPLPPGLAAAVSVVHDREPFGGPLIGLSTGLAAVRTPLAIVVGGDMPRLVPAVLGELLAAVERGAAAAVLEVPDRIQPLPLALRVAPARAALDQALREGARSLRDLVRATGAMALPGAVWLALDPLAETLVDIDRPADLGP